MKNRNYDDIDLNNIDWSLYNDESKGYIYTITNTINGKQYVGQTNNPYRRWKKHVSESRKKEYPYKNYLYMAIKKYGLINFVFEVIEICELNIINDREIYWISILNTYVPNGYNLSHGGMALYGEDNPFYGHTHTEETRKIIAEKNKGRKKSEKEIEELRKRNIGEKNPFYGKKHTENTKNRIRETCKNKGIYLESSERMKGNTLYKNIKRKKVAMISLESGEVLKIFDNAVQAGEYIKELGLCKTNRPHNSITGVCNGHETSIYGYFWKYLED